MFKRLIMILTLSTLLILSVPMFACASVATDEDIDGYDFFRIFNIDTRQYFVFDTEEEEAVEDENIENEFGIGITRKDVFDKDPELEGNDQVSEENSDSENLDETGSITDIEETEEVKEETDSVDEESKPSEEESDSRDKDSKEGSVEEKTDVPEVIDAYLIAYSSPTSDDSTDNSNKEDEDSESTDSELGDQVVSEELEIYTTSEYTTDDINDFKVLYLNKGFEKEITPTFASMMNVSGEGKEGTKVGILIYSEDSEGYSINFESIKDIGASGLYSEILEFGVIGSNYVIVAVMKDDFLLHRQFIINRKEEKTKDKLENIELDFIDKSEEDEDKEDVFEFIEDIINNDLSSSDLLELFKN